MIKRAVHFFGRQQDLGQLLFDTKKRTFQREMQE